MTFKNFIRLERNDLRAKKSFSFTHNFIKASHQNLRPDPLAWPCILINSKLRERPTSYHIFKYSIYFQKILGFKILFECSDDFFQPNTFCHTYALEFKIFRKL